MAWRSVQKKARAGLQVEDEQLKIHLNGDELKQVKEFKYPWATITENVNSESGR